MLSADKNYKEIGSVAVIGNYLPRLCGIATFTTDLVEALSKEAPDVNLGAVVMNDNLEGYKYPEKVRFEIQQNKLSDYSIALIPLFILMGQFAGISGLSSDIYFAADKWLRKLPGSLGLATVIGCSAFAAVCGSSVATAATMAAPNPACLPPAFTGGMTGSAYVAVLTNPYPPAL